MFTHVDKSALTPLGVGAPYVTNAENNARRMRNSLIYFEIPKFFIVKHLPDMFDLTKRGHLRMIYDSIYPDGTLEQSHYLTYFDIVKMHRMYGNHKTNITKAKQRAARLQQTCSPTLPTK